MLTIDRRATELTAALRNFVEFVRRGRQDFGPNPAPQSEAAVELATCIASAGKAKGMSPVKYAFSMADRGLVAAEDHALAVSDLLGSEESMLGSLVACRSAIEASARAWYLVEPAIGARERVRRNIAERVESAYELARATEWMKPVRPSFMLTSAHDDARDLGIPLTAKGRVVGGRPGQTELCGLLLTDCGVPEGLYSFLSAVAHGTEYALMSFYEYSNIDLSHPDRATGQWGVDQFHLEVAAHTTLLAVAAAQRRLWAMYGWDIDVLDERQRIAARETAVTDGRAPYGPHH